MLSSIDHCVLEHIKYPDSNKAPPAGPPTGPSRKSSVQAQPTAPGQRPSSPENAINGTRATSPIEQRADADEIRRAMVSPTGGRSVQANGVASQSPANSSVKGKPPRPRREDGDELDDERAAEMIITGERAMSPEQARARSPTAFAHNRAVSPVQNGDPYPQQPLSMAGVAMGINGTTATVARSASPSIGKTSLEGFYGQKPASPVPNGYHKAGSTGNITADLIRDLKEKEAEMEAMKKREVWMKAALSKASRAGFVYADAEDLSLNAEDEDIDSRKVAEMVLNLKHLKAKLQVCIY